MPDALKYQVLITTCPDAALAERIADELVVNNLAACVQIIPGMKSVYRWQGRIEHAEEWLVLIKSVTRNYTEIEKKIVAMHTYTVPEIIALPVAAGWRDYLSWIDDNTGAR
jgi:periplasmic divalent cation tolerance protein